MFHVPNLYRFREEGHVYHSENADGNNGVFLVKFGSNKFVCIASDGMGWEHVSVSRKGKIPSWEEMCFFKDLFWDEEDRVVQFHPPKSEYVNNCQWALHMWRPAAFGIEVPHPPKELVGFPEMNV